MLLENKTIIDFLRLILEAKIAERDSTKSLLASGDLPEEYWRADGMPLAFDEVLEILHDLENADAPSL